MKSSRLLYTIAIMWQFPADLTQLNLEIRIPTNIDSTREEVFYLSIEK